MNNNNSDILTDKQKRFTDEYIVDCNATQAAIRAGYSPKSASRTGSKLLNNAKVRKYIDKELDVIRSKNIADAEEVMRFLTQVMRGDVKEPMVLRGENGQVVEMVAFSARERLKAAELIGKRYGIFSENVQVQSSEPVIIFGGDDIED